MTDDAPVPISTAKGNRPARGYSRPPFEPGNQKAVVHGAHSPSIVAALAAQFAEAAIAASPVLSIERFQWSMRSWSHAEARCELIRRHLDEHGILNARSTPRMSLLATLAASERAAAKGRSELGLSPESAAKIALTLRLLGADALSPEERAKMLPAGSPERRWTR